MSERQVTALTKKKALNSRNVTEHATWATEISFKLEWKDEGATLTKNQCDKYHIEIKRDKRMAKYSKVVAEASIASYSVAGLRDRS